MKAPLTPHYFQKEAVAAIFAALEEYGAMPLREDGTPEPCNPVVAMPTGTGKSVVIADFIKQLYQRYPYMRTLMCTHVKELIIQNMEKMLNVWPTAPAGVYSSGLNRFELAPITFCGIASVYNMALAFGKVDVFIVDECHLVSDKDASMYQTFIQALMLLNPYMRIIGLSATPFRIGMGYVTEGSLFSHICFDLTGRDAFNRLIIEGYLSNLFPRPTTTKIDTSQVAIHGGEFVQNQLQAASDKEAITYGAIEEMVQFGEDRRSWLMFTTGIEHTIHVAKMMNEHFNIPTACVHSKMKDGERDRNIEHYKLGKYRCMVSGNILTTGFDHPWLDLIGDLQATNSPGKHVQKYGRGTRCNYAPGYDLSRLDQRLASIVAGGKNNCLVLDFARNTERLGPINDPQVPKRRGPGGRPGIAPVRICDGCGVYNHASAPICANCGFEFPRVIKFGDTASTAQVIAGPVDPPHHEIFKLDRVVYGVHERSERPPSLKVIYYCGLRMFREYICFEHRNFPLHMAHEWWRERAPDPIPTTVNEAIQRMNQIQVPRNLRVWMNRKPEPKVVGYDFTGTSFTADQVDPGSGALSQNVETQRVSA